MMDSTMAIVQPMGHDSQMPVVPSAVRESVSASTTRSTRSVNVATMNCFISPAPRRMPSDTSLADTMK